MQSAADPSPFATRKRLHAIVPAGAVHWVGDGFPVKSLFSHDTLRERAGPFLLLDYAEPHEFAPLEARAASTTRRGVGPHPHRGFETVTIVFAGEVDHRDSHGGGGTIGPGDVQWMTAASGLVHEEFHSEAFARRGGTLEMAQLWVNLPARDKRHPPRYQSLAAATIPTVALAGGAGSLRVIAGDHGGARGPARTFTPIHVFDLRLVAGGKVALELPRGHATLLLLRRGDIALAGHALSGHAPVAAAPRLAPLDLAVFERREPSASGATETLVLEAQEASELLLFDGAPIDEPIVAYGPFVMNTRAEIVQAIEDFQAGRMGALAE